jgi:hypothetical protein
MAVALDKYGKIRAPIDHGAFGARGLGQTIAALEAMRLGAASGQPAPYKAIVTPLLAPRMAGKGAACAILSVAHLQTLRRAVVIWRTATG